MPLFSKDRREMWVGLGLSVGVTGLILGLFGTGSFEWLEQHSYDLRTQWRGVEALDVPVMLVLNDEATSERLGVAPSRISRMVYAKAIHNLHRANAKLIAMDILFADSHSELEDATLEKAIQESGNVILARYIGSDGHRVPLKRFAHVALGQGLVNVSPDSDGVLRGVPLLGGYYDEGKMTTFLTLGAEVARQFTTSGGGGSLEFVSQEKATIGSLVIQLVHNQVLVNFAGPSGSVPSLSLWQVAEGKFSDELFEGKIVLFGSSVASLHDFYHIPLANKEIQFIGSAQTGVHAAQMPGVEIHAHVIRTILGGKGIQRTSTGTVFGLIGLLGIMCCLMVILRPRGEWGVVIATIFLLGVVVSASMFLFFYHNYWVDMVPLLAVMNGHFAMATAYQRYLVVRQKDQLRRMFSHLISPTVSNDLWSQRGTILEGNHIVPQQLVLTILIIRFRNMERIFQSLHSEGLLAWWSIYRSGLTRVLRQYGGLLSVWEDEGLRAYFGAPFPSPSSEAVQHDAVQAVSCAFQMLQTIRALNEPWQEKGIPELEAWAILYTGHGIGGSIQDSEGSEYKVLGEAVQMMHRLEKWAWGCPIPKQKDLVLAGHSTVGYLDSLWSAKKIGDINEWTGNGKVPIYQLQEPLSSATYSTS